MKWVFNHLVELLFLQMALFKSGVGAKTYIIALDFLEGNSRQSQILSELLRFSRSWLNMKNGRAIFLRFFPALDLNMKKRLGLVWIPFRALVQTWKGELSLFFVFTLWIKNENDTECILRCDHAR